MVDGITKHINLKPKTLDYAEIQKLHIAKLADRISDLEGNV